MDIFYISILTNVEEFAGEVVPGNNNTNLTIEEDNFVIQVQELPAAIDMITDPIMFTAEISDSGSIRVFSSSSVVEEDDQIVSASLPAEATANTNTSVRFAFTIFNDDTLFFQRNEFVSNLRTTAVRGGIISVQVDGIQPSDNLSAPIELLFGSREVSTTT